LESISLKDCSKIYQDDNELIENRVTCFKRYLKEKYILENNASNVVRFIDNEFEYYPKIYNYFQTKDSSVLISIFSGYYYMEDIIEWIILNKVTDRKDRVWSNLFLSHKKISLEQSVNYISNYPDWNNGITKYLIQRVLVKLNDVENFENRILELYDNHYNIRLLFLRMLEPTRFKNKKMAHIILDKFESIGFPNKDEGLVEKIRNWDYSSNSRIGFKNREEFIKAINNNNQDFSNLKTLGHFFYKLKQTKKEIILDAYYNLSFNENLPYIYPII